MRNAIFLDNNIQSFLVKQAIKEKMEQLRKNGYSEKSLELVELGKTLPKIKLENGLPIL
jgi:hypothetical protein